MVYPDGVMAIEPMLDTLLLVEYIDHLVDLIGICACEGHYFVVLGHLLQKVFSMRPENMTLGFASAVAEDLDDIDHQGGPFVQSLPEIGVRCYRQKGQRHVQLRNTQEKGEVL